MIGDDVVLRATHEITGIIRSVDHIIEHGNLRLPQGVKNNKTYAVWDMVYEHNGHTSTLLHIAVDKISGAWVFGTTSVLLVYLDDSKDPVERTNLLRNELNAGILYMGEQKDVLNAFRDYIKKIPAERMQHILHYTKEDLSRLGDPKDRRIEGAFSRKEIDAIIARARQIGTSLSGTQFERYR